MPRFRATLSESGRGGGRWIELPFDGKDVFGEARAPVHGTVNGTPFRSRLAVYGGVTYVGLRREIREAAGVDVGDELDVLIERDDVPREVQVPEALARAFAAAPDAREIFDRLAFTHRREYATWIAEARRDDTRERRVAKAIDMLRGGTKHP